MPRTERSTVCAKSGTAIKNGSSFSASSTRVAWTKTVTSGIERRSARGTKDGHRQAAKAHTAWEWLNEASVRRTRTGIVASRRLGPTQWLFSGRDRARPMVVHCRSGRLEPDQRAVREQGVGCSGGAGTAEHRCGSAGGERRAVPPCPAYVVYHR